MTEGFRPTLRLLPSGEAERIAGEACRILERVGVLVENVEARGLLQEAGASECEGRHLIPEKLVRQLLARVPSRVQVFDRLGTLTLDLGDDRVHFDPGSAAIHVLESGARRRDATAADAVALARLVDGLPHYAAQSTALSPSDIPGEVADRYRLYLCLKHGGKPVVTGTFRKDGFAPMRAMLEAVRGGAGALREKPLAIFDCCPSPPLKWSDLTAQALIDCARSGIPAELVSMPLTGATSPVTLREAVVQHCAESLSGIVIHQLAGPGAPIIYGGAPSAFDMRHGTTPMGAIETMMIDAAYAQVGKHLGLPTHTYLGLSEAKVPDYQAGFESGIGVVIAALAGINLISGPGMLDYLLSQSMEKLILDHEVCGMALRLVRGIEKREGDSVALIAELVAKGDFLGHPHTRKNWRSELSVPSVVVDRDTYGDWSAKGGTWAHQRAAAEVARRLALSPGATLEPPVLRGLEEIMLGEVRKFGQNCLPVEDLAPDR